MNYIAKKLCCFNLDNPNFFAFERHAELTNANGFTE